MSTYICKCGRKVQKSITADNTGNRQTEGCTGCPYLLPWGPMVYHEDVGYQMDVQGYECRMSPRLRYTSTYWGGAKNKSTLRILSLDFDWMEQVDAWISEHYPNGELSGRFERSKMRGTDFSNEGRYSWSIYCAQNRKGMEAKAALIAEFFTPEKYRKDIVCPGMTTTAEQAEKEIVLKSIAAGKAAAQEKEAALCADLTPTTNPTPTAAPSSTQSPVTVPTASIGETVPGGPNKETAAGRAYRSVTGMIYAVRKYSDEAFRIMCHYAGEEWMLATSPQLSAPCRCAESLQEVLDACAARTGWKEFKTECEEKNLTAAPTPDAAATTAAPAAEQEETLTTSESVEDASMCRASTSGATVEENLSDQPCPADAVPAIENPSNAATACSGAEPPTFDYSGLDTQTIAALRNALRIFRHGKSMAEIGMRNMAVAVSMAHDELCRTVVAQSDNSKHGNRGENTFRNFCTQALGISKDTAYRLLQVSNLFDASSPNQQKVLAELTPSLLYAAAKPSAPAELVQAVKDGDITTHKQYQELLAEIKARDAKIEELLESSEAADRRTDAAEAKAREACTREEQARAAAHQYHVQAEEATTARNALLDQQSMYMQKVAEAEQQRDAAKQQAAKDKRRADEAEKERDGARDALSAAKLRADKWREKAEAAQVQASAPPIEAKVIDPEEVDRLAAEKARALAAQQNAGRQEQNARDAYDAFILAARQLDAIWQTLAPRIPQLDAGQRCVAVEHFVQKLMYIKEEIYKCP